eukprot:3085921-Pleurochrysis_carterae.AAC.1
MAAESRLRADGALPTEAVTPRANFKTKKQLGTPTIDAEELAEIAEIDLTKLRVAADAAREANDEELVSDALQDRQPSEPPALDARLLRRKLEVRWRYLLPSSTPIGAHPPSHRASAHIATSGRGSDEVAGRRRARGAIIFCLDHSAPWEMEQGCAVCLALGATERA